MDEIVVIEGPPFQAVLSPLDAKFVGLYSRRILVFKPVPLDKYKTAEAFKRGVLGLVHQVPILGGVTTYDRSNARRQTGWKSIEKGPGIEITIRDVSSELDLVGLERDNFPPAALRDTLLVPVDANLAGIPYPACKFQLSFTTDAALLAVCIAHTVSDGPGISTIIRLLANNCHQVQKTGEVMPDSLCMAREPRLGLDRSCYIGLKHSQSAVQRMDSIEDHPAYHMVETQLPTREVAAERASLESTKSPSSDLRKHRQLIVKMYRITESQARELKFFATTTRISTHDAISALAWRCIIVNRISAGVIARSGTETTLYVPVSTRRHLNQSDDFIGNTVYQTCCRMDVADLLSPDGISIAAARIRTVINAVTRDSVAGYVELIESLPDLSMTAWKGTAKDSKLYTSDVSLVSCYHSETVYESDWGLAFGRRVISLRPTELGFAGSMGGLHYVLPREEGRGCEVQMSPEPLGLATMEKDSHFVRFFGADTRLVQ